MMKEEDALAVRSAVELLSEYAEQIRAASQVDGAWDLSDVDVRRAYRRYTNIANTVNKLRRMIGP